MTMNSSSSSNDSILDIHLSVDLPLDIACLISEPFSYFFTIYFITSIFLLLPLCIFIFYHGFQRCQKKRSTSLAVTMSHSDSITYHMMVMEMIIVIGCILCCCGIHSHQPKLLLAGVLLSCLTWHGEIFFHVLMCVERHLAVVHPITYMRLRNERGVRIRNISIGCVWLLCLAGTGLMNIKGFFIVVDFCTLISALIIASFCSFSVLRVLIHPGPGVRDGCRERVDPSKHRAFYTVLAILGMLVLRFAWGLARTVLFVLGTGHKCVIAIAGFWFYLPSSLVLPLLFLHRAGKLMCRKKKSNEVQG